MIDSILKNILENAELSVNVTSKFNVYVGKAKESAPVENIKQAIQIIKNNNTNISDDRIQNDIMNSQAIAVAVDKKNKKTAGIALIKKPVLDEKIKIFKKAGIEDLSSEYIFELDGISVAREYRGKGLGVYLIQRLVGLRTGRGTTIYCQTNSEEVSRVLKVNFRFENLKDDDEKPYLLGLM